nr:MAG TPA: hypothetical protein [Caudoviricetes sp.]
MKVKTLRNGAKIDWHSYLSTFSFGLSMKTTHIYEEQGARIVEFERTPAECRSYAGGSCKKDARQPSGGSQMGNRRYPNRTEASQRACKALQMHDR